MGSDKRLRRDTWKSSLGILGGVSLQTAMSSKIIEYITALNKGLFGRNYPYYELQSKLLVYLLIPL